MILVNSDISLSLLLQKALKVKITIISTFCILLNITSYKIFCNTHFFSMKAIVIRLQSTV